MWETGTGWLNKRYRKITVFALDRVPARVKHRLKHWKYTLWPISDQIFRVIWSTSVPKPSNLLHVDKCWNSIHMSQKPQKLRQRSRSLCIQLSSPSLEGHREGNWKIRTQCDKLGPLHVACWLSQCSQAEHAVDWLFLFYVDWLWRECMLVGLVTHGN